MPVRGPMWVHGFVTRAHIDKVQGCGVREAWPGRELQERCAGVGCSAHSVVDIPTERDQTTQALTRLDQRVLD